MRQRNTGGRFNSRGDLENIFEGMSDDLQGYEGQTVAWYTADFKASHVDSIYDVGDAGPAGGRAWKPPFPVPVLSVQNTQGAEESEEQGLYSSDSIRIIISYDQAEKVGLRDFNVNSNNFLNDRIVWNNEVYTPTRIQPRGLIRGQYTVIGIDAVQVNPEEMVNDQGFSAFLLTNMNTNVVVPRLVQDAALTFVAPEPYIIGTGV